MYAEKSEYSESESKNRKVKTQFYLHKDWQTFSL